MTALSEVYWIGGMPASGKTTVARRIADQLELAAYHLDDHEHAHLSRVTKEQQPNWYFSLHEKYLTLSPQRLVEILLAECEERMSFVLDDLRKHRAASLIAEGAVFLPGILQQQRVDPTRSMFLILESDARADRWERLRSSMRSNVLVGYEDDDKAWATWMERDRRVSEAIASQARAANMGVLEIDAQTSTDAVVDKVADHFGVKS